MNTQIRLTNRTAVYGPVRTVVWEGLRREADPYPNSTRSFASAFPSTNVYIYLTCALHR